MLTQGGEAATADAHDVVRGAVNLIEGQMSVVSCQLSKKLGSLDLQDWTHIGTMNLNRQEWRDSVLECGPDASGPLLPSAYLKAPEDWRTPKPDGIPDGSWRASTSKMGRALGPGPTLRFLCYLLFKQIVLSWLRIDRPL